MSYLERFGLEWKSDKDFICHRMADGYWTPWHIAEEELTAARYEIENLKSGQIKTDNSQTLVNALEEIEALKLANRDLQHWFDDARDEAEKLRGQLDEVHSAFGIGSNARTLSVLMTNIENVKRFAEYLHAVERQFFMVPGEPDEDYPDCEPEDECPVNSWGSTKEQYLRQFNVALLIKKAEAFEAFVADVVAEQCRQRDELGVEINHTLIGQRRLEAYAQRLRTQADELEGKS